MTEVPSLRCTTIKMGDSSHRFSDTDVEAVREYDLDFILNFGLGIPSGGIVNAAHYGVWSFHHGDEEKYRGSPLCFWEIYNGDHITGASLQKLTDRLDESIVLRKGVFRTIKHSHSKNIDQACFQSAKWPAQVCIDICNDVADYLGSPPYHTEAPIYHIPNNFQMLLFITKMFRNGLSRSKGLFRYDHWNVGIVHEPIGAFLNPNAKPEIHWFPTPERCRFLADPFGIARDSQVTILCEDFDYRSQRGCISSFQLDGTSSWSVPQRTMDFSFHMSYPYLFQYQGEIYCIPETIAIREISLYKAEKLPNQWIKVGTLIDNIEGVDTTVFQYDGLWWLMCTYEEQDPELNLFVWYAPDLMGPWKPHAVNPVKTDIRSSRPAGTPFMYNGNLYRPTQDCSRIYGGRIIINRVTCLTPLKFEEERVAVIEPRSDSSFPDGLHTLSSVGNSTLIDGRQYMFAPSKIIRLLNKEIFRFLCERRLTKRRESGLAAIREEDV
ncbi:MAG: hypothetical protein GY845_12635 [Planctomycetes bacterium]|nr:hypothetical protein [Planctomycetota bacterium]